MGKNKITRFEEMENFERVFQPTINEIRGTDYFLKHNWRKTVFKNDNPIILEVGCGKGEYTTGLAKMFPDKNFIGIDIKGARMWRGAKTINEENLTNAAFLRTRMELIRSFFGKDEVDEIWITFPDPQPKKANNRLSSAKFLMEYQNFLKNEGVVHLKTDSRELHDYTLEVLKQNELETLQATNNLYANHVSDVLNIKTFYEQSFLEQGKPITYIQLKLPASKALIHVADKDDK